LIYQILNILSRKLPNQSPLPEMSERVSECILFIISKIRENSEKYGSDSDDVSLEGLFLIYKTLISISCDSSYNPTVRGYIYSSIIQFTQLMVETNGLKGKMKTYEDNRDDGRDENIHTRDENIQRKINENISKMMSKEPLLRLACSDTTSSHLGWQSVSYTLISLLLRYDSQNFHRRLMRSFGYISHFINLLKTSQVELKRVMLDAGGDFRSTYVYECQMSVLNTFSNEYFGAESLFSEGIVDQLNKLIFIDERPHDLAGSDGWLPSNVERYNRLVYPVISVLNSMFQHLNQKETFLSQILNFIMEHSDVINSILQNNDTNTSDSVRLLTSILFLFENLLQKKPSAFQEINSKGIPLSRRVVSLFRKYTQNMSSSSQRNEDSMQVDDETEVDEDLLLDLSQQITSLLQLLSEIPEANDMLFTLKKDKVKPTISQLGSDIQIWTEKTERYFQERETGTMTITPFKLSQYYRIVEYLYHILYKQLECNMEQLSDESSKKELAVKIKPILDRGGMVVKKGESMISYNSSRSKGDMSRSTQVAIRKARDILS